MITRTCRVMPLHLAVLLFFIGFECLKLVMERYGLSLNYPAFSGDRAPSEILPNLLLIQAWWPTFNALSFNYPSWFISVEFYLWMIFALILFSCRAWRASCSRCCACWRSSRSTRISA